MQRITAQCNEFGILKNKPLEKEELGEIKQIVLKYMNQRKFVVWASSAKVYDYVADAQNNNYCCIKYADDDYEWTSNDILYIEIYNMKISAEFIMHILNKVIT